MARFSQHQWTLWQGKTSGEIREQLLQQADLIHSVGPWLAFQNEPAIFDGIAAGNGLGYNASPLFGVLQHAATWTADCEDQEYIRLTAAFHELLDRKPQLNRPLDFHQTPLQTISAYISVNVLDQFEQEIDRLGQRVRTEFQALSAERLIKAIKISPPNIELGFDDLPFDLFKALLDRGLLTHRLDHKSVEIQLPSMLTESDIQWLVSRIEDVWQLRSFALPVDQSQSKSTDRDAMIEAGKGSHEIQSNAAAKSKTANQEPNQSEYSYRHYRFHAQLLRYKHSIALGRSPNSDATAEFVRRSLPSNLVQGKATFVRNDNWPRFRQQVEEMQHQVYEPVRRTAIEKFDALLADPFGFGLVITVGNQLAGIGFAGPLQLFPEERGTQLDPFRADRHTLYVLDVTVAESFRGNLGTLIKQGIMLHATAAGHAAIHGRNRDRLARTMWAINLGMGSYQLQHLVDDYPDQKDHRDCIYYRCPLRWPSSWRHQSARFVTEFLESDQEEQWTTLARLVNGGTAKG